MWDKARCGKAGTVGKVGFGGVWHGKAGPVRRDKVRWGVVWSGVVWQAR